MGRRADFYTTVGDGPNALSVGYSAPKRDGYWRVRFLTPDGKRVEKRTGCKVVSKRPDANYHVEVARVIARAYAPAYPDPKRTTWDAALDKVEQTAPDLRPDTLIAYRKAVRVLRGTLDGDGIVTTAPVEITATLATRFSRVWLAGTFKRGKASDAKEYRRKPTTLAFYLRQLSALWGQFADLGYVREHPWKSVRKPQTDKVRKAVPTEDEIATFFAWVHTRYPRWERLHALLELKALTGCRSLDLCQLRSDQLRDGRVVWTADQTKQREGRAVLLPDDLFATIRRLAGPVYLWEGVLTDLREFRPSKNRMPVRFDPKTVFWVMNNIFREFAEAHPDKRHLTPHALRRRAITLTVTATQSVDATAQAIGLNPATARRYYLDSQRAFNTDDVFRKMSGSLLPRAKDSAT